jgi:hypothetical protein
MEICSIHTINQVAFPCSKVNYLKYIATMTLTVLKQSRKGGWKGEREEGREKGRMEWREGGRKERREGGKEEGGRKGGREKGRKGSRKYRWKEGSRYVRDNADLNTASSIKI